MLRRRTRIERKTPLATPLATPLCRAGMPAGPVKRRRPGRKSNAEKQCREALPVRSGDVCEIQVSGVCTGVAQVPSHRKRRSQSTRDQKWSLANVLHGCLACERYLTRYGGTARCRSWGWTVPRSLDPVEVPVWRRQRWVWLLAGGGVVELDLMEVAAWVISLESKGLGA